MEQPKAAPLGFSHVIPDASEHASHNERLDGKGVSTKGHRNSICSLMAKPEQKYKRRPYARKCKVSVFRCMHSQFLIQEDKIKAHMNAMECEIRGSVSPGILRVLKPFDAHMEHEEGNRSDSIPAVRQDGDQYPSQDGRRGLP